MYIAEVAESGNALGSRPSVLLDMQVQILPSALKQYKKLCGHGPAWLRLELPKFGNSSKLGFKSRWPHY